jgi:hypothetical protein
VKPLTSSVSRMREEVPLAPAPVDRSLFQASRLSTKWLDNLSSVICYSGRSDPTVCRQWWAPT